MHIIFAYAFPREGMISTAPNRSCLRALSTRVHSLNILVVISCASTACLICAAVAVASAVTAGPGFTGGEKV